MTLPPTLLLLAAGLALCIISRWYESWPRPLGEVRLFPSTLVMALGVLLVVVALAHLVSLVTGVHLRGRAAV